MRFALLLLFPSIALAQPFIGPEITSTPLPTRGQRLNIASPAVAMARDERGVAIAWTALDQSGATRLYVARLDGGAQVSGAVHEMPTSSPMDRIDVEAPSIAKSASGPGFVLAWIEVTSFATSVFCRLDADLNPTPPRTLAATDAGGTLSAAIARSGKSNWLTADAEVWRLNADGTLDAIASGIFASDMVAATDFPIMVGLRESVVPVYTPCAEIWFPPCVHIAYETHYALQVVWLYAASAARAFSYATEAQPAIQSDGSGALIVWFDSAQKAGGPVTSTRLKPEDVWNFDRTTPHQIFLGMFGPDSTPTRPDIAHDGERYVVVWRTRTPAGDYDIVGASIDRDDKVTFLPIATSSADERDPSVIAVGDGRFLVAYEKIAGGERRLAGRFIDFGNRRHSVR